MTGPAGIKTICKNCFTRWNEYCKAVEHAGTKADGDEQGDKGNIEPTQ